MQLLPFVHRYVSKVKVISNGLIDIVYKYASIYVYNSS